MIEAIIFDLDGTLYRNPDFEKDFYRVAARLVGQSRGGSSFDGEQILSAAIERLEEACDYRPSLSQVCMELGIDLTDLHRAYQDLLHPEEHLNNDPVLIALLESLAARYRLFIYTNNNLPLCRKILAILGVDSLFEAIFSIEMTWQPKPDRETLALLLARIALPPDACLFVGDRPPIDLAMPADYGCQTLHTEGVVDLLQVHQRLGLIP